MKRKLFWLNPKRMSSTTLVWTLLVQASSAYATSTASPGYVGFVSQLPGIYTTPPDVNVMFTFDDSLSMPWETIPDDTDGVGGDMWTNSWNSAAMLNTFKWSNAVWRFYRSTAGNPLYYNPMIRYQPWPTAANDQISMPQASTTAACQVEDILPAALPACGSSTARNLQARVVVNTPDDTNQNNESKGYWPATYFNYVGSTPLTPNGRATAGPNSTLNTSSNFQKVEIRPTLPGSTTVATYPKVATRTDCAGAIGATGCSYAEEIRNFANWFQYYRTRALMGKGASAVAFSRQGTNMRVGLGIINQGSLSIDGATSPGTIKLGVRKFQTTARTAFYNGFYSVPTQTPATPLRKAANEVGLYFSRTDSKGPWGDNPGIGTELPATHQACRRSFHILTTDGLWRADTGAFSSPVPSPGGPDNFSGRTYVNDRTGLDYAYSDTATSTTDSMVARFGINPFADSHLNTLADATAYYWKTDLRTDLQNRVLPSSRDPAFWQHLTTFTVGMGVSGTLGLTQAQLDTAVRNRTAIAWPAPSDNSVNNGDDLVHASVNGHGRYFLATNPQQFANDLAAALAEVADQPLDLASVAADAPQVRAGDKVYQATFSPSKWYGRLYAFTQQGNGGVNNRPTDSSYTNPTQVWEASNKMPAPGSRSIFTSACATSTACLFQWANLSTTQRLALNSDSTLVSYLSGDSAREIANGGPFRDRARYTVGTVTGGVLGDVVNGSPIKGPDFGGGYDRLPSTDAAAAAYTTFRTDATLTNMRNTIFLGANDGMLHAFSITDGIERFAYIPNAVYEVPRSTTGGLSEKKLQLLSDPNYTHRFTVDGPPNIGDAYIGGGWKSVLLSSNGAGARGIFAMNVTNPVVGTGTAFGTDDIMWEFTEANNADMGFVLGYPHIVRMRDGNWAALFGNGFDSANGRAKLFILNLATGAVIREFSVDTGTAGNNGLSQPNFVLNANREVIAIYAGDLKGNLWKFDVSNSLSANWNVAFGSTPLFSAVNASGVAQPITVMPEITSHPSGGALIAFGTGKLFEASDTGTATASPPNVNLNIQSLYGIWDKPSETTGIALTSANRSTVLQSQTAAPIAATASYGSTSSNGVDWSAKRGWFLDLESGGERVNLPAQQVKSVLFMVANTPVTDPCANGGTSRVFVLDPTTGAAPTFAVFDVNNNQAFDSSEIGINVKVNRSGLLTQPIFQLPSQTSYNAPLLGVSPFELFDRGQSSAARAGGVELSRSSGGTVSATNPCALLMTAAQSDTSLMQQYIQTCGASSSPPTPTPPRISWRQLR